MSIKQTAVVTNDNELRLIQAKMEMMEAKLANTIDEMKQNEQKLNTRIKQLET